MNDGSISSSAILPGEVEEIEKTILLEKPSETRGRSRSLTHWTDGLRVKFGSLARAVAFAQNRERGRVLAGHNGHN